MSEEGNEESFNRDEELERIKKLGIEKQSEESFNILVNYHEKFEKEEEERKKKEKEEFKPFVL